MNPGESRHETCRFGTLTEAYFHSPVGGETQGVRPLCTWSIPEPAPPAAVRGWGGAVEPMRDCLKCPAWKPVEAIPFALPTPPLPEGYTAFTGGPRPVAARVPVKVQLRDGVIVGPRRGDSWPWNDPTDVPWDIVAFQEQPET